MSEYDTLKSDSIILIGERQPNRIAWIQLYDVSDSLEENEIQKLLIGISQQVIKGRYPSGSARKFLNGKLIYYEPPKIQESTSSRAYAIFTKQKKINQQVKKAVKAVALRGGVYSANRFFSETIDLLENPSKMRDYTKFSTLEALARIDSFVFDHIDLNELGFLISLVDRSVILDHSTLERIYFHVYSSIKHLSDDEDHDEFLDAAYLVALRYLETNNFHLALELFKSVIPVAISNERFDLEVACRIQISIIYKKYFPMSGEYIIESLRPIKKRHLEETNNKLLEIYYCLLGHAYLDLGESINAGKAYRSAIKVADQDVNSPLWIAEAYNYLGKQKEIKLLLRDANRHYLTAATLAFTSGDLSLQEIYKTNASKVEITIAKSIIYMALVHRMEGDLKNAEFRAWESLRVLLKSYLHCSVTELHSLKEISKDILQIAPIVFGINEKKKINLNVIHKLTNFIKNFQFNKATPTVEHDQLLKLTKEIENNIPLPAPTFLLLSIDGRLMTIGKIEDSGWKQSDVEGSLLSGILAAIMSLLTEVSPEKSSLRTIDAGNTQIIIEQSDNIIVALLVDRDINEFRVRLVRMVKFIDQYYGDKVRYWNGNRRIFDKVKTEAQKLLAPSIIAAHLE